MRRAKVLPVVIASTVVGGVVAAPAAGAVRYATAGFASSTAPCTQASPCHLKRAIELAASGDEVIVLPGAYSVSSEVEAPFGSGLDVHGVAGEPRPRIVATNGIGASSALALSGRYRLAHLEIDARSASTGRAATLIGPTSGAPAILDGVLLRGGPGNSTVFMRGITTLRTVLMRSDAGPSGALQLDSGAQVTAVGSTFFSRDGRAISALTGGADAIGLTVRNSVLRGDTDLALNKLNGPITFHADHTALREDRITKSGAPEPVVTYGPNVRSIASLFVDEAGGDLRLRGGTSAVDAGIGDPNLTALDIAGLPRVIGPATDFGAYEHTPPPGATTASATVDGPTTAFLTASVTPNAQETTYRFEVGPIPGLYTRIVADATPVGSGIGAAGVGAVATDLAPASGYAFRVVATNASGTTFGAPVSFTTPAAPPAAEPPAAPAPPAPPAPAPAVAPAPAAVAPPALVPAASRAAAVVSVPAQGLRMDKRGRVLVRVLCSKRETATCRGTVDVRTVSRLRLGGRRQIVRIGPRRFAVRPGGTTRVRLTVPSRARTVLRRSRTVKVRAAARTTGADARTRTATRRLNLRTR